MGLREESMEREAISTYEKQVDNWSEQEKQAIKFFFDIEAKTQTSIGSMLVESL